MTKHREGSGATLGPSGDLTLDDTGICLVAQQSDTNSHETVADWKVCNICLMSNSIIMVIVSIKA